MFDLINEEIQMRLEFEMWEEGEDSS